MTLIRLRVCAGWSEPLLVAYTTMLEISCRGSYKSFSSLPSLQRTLCNIHYDNKALQTDLVDDFLLNHKTKEHQKMHVCPWNARKIHNLLMVHVTPWRDILIKASFNLQLKNTLKTNRMVALRMVSTLPPPLRNFADISFLKKISSCFE